MVEENISIDFFKLMGNGIVNDELAQTIKDKLLLKYNESFEVTHLGRRYGTGDEDISVTAYCHPKDNERIVFTAVLNADRVNFKDDYILRKINVELEDSIETLAKEEDEDILVRSIIIKKYKYDKEVGVEEFIKKEPQTNFLLHIYLKNNKKEKKKKILKKIEKKYKGIKLRGNIQVLKKEYFQELKKELKQIPSSEDYTIDSNKIIETYRIEEVL